MPEKTNNDRLDWRVISGCLSQYQLQCIRTNAVFEAIGSTNDWALAQMQSPHNLPAVCFAGQQSHGRGRQGRTWVSPCSKNIYMSLAWLFAMPATEMSGLGLAAAIPVAMWLQERGLEAKLKWPNDVWVDGKKIAGILLESRIKANGQLCVVIGVGLNVAMPDVQGIDQQWTDMSRLLGDQQVLDRNIIAGSLLAGLIDVCEKYQESGFSAFINQWEVLDLCRGAELEILASDRVFCGTGRGVDGSGLLRVLVDGEEMLFASADVKVRVRP